MIKNIFKFINYILAFVKYKIKKSEEPLEQHRKRYAQIDKDIAEQDSEQATFNATADLDELDRLQKLKSDSKRPDGDKSKER